MKFLVFFQAWQHAQSMVLRKKEQKARHEMGGKTDKIPGILKKGPKMSQGHYAPETFKM